MSVTFNDFKVTTSFSLEVRLRVVVGCIAKADR